MEDRRTVIIKLNGEILGSALGIDWVCYPICPSNVTKFKNVLVSNYMDATASWSDTWTNIIVYPNTNARIAKFVNNDRLETLVIPSNIKMVLLNGKNVRQLKLAEGVEFVFVRKCENLKEIYLPKSVKKAVLNARTNIINFEEVSNNPITEVTYDSKVNMEIADIRDAFSQIIRDNVDIEVTSYAMGAKLT